MTSDFTQFLHKTPRAPPHSKTTVHLHSFGMVSANTTLRLANPAPLSTVPQTIPHTCGRSTFSRSRTVVVVVPFHQSRPFRIPTCCMPKQKFQITKKTRVRLYWSVSCSIQLHHTKLSSGGLHQPILIRLGTPVLVSKSPPLRCSFRDL